jgi:hypothetical protein
MRKLADGTASISFGHTSQNEEWTIEKVTCQVSTAVSEPTFATDVNGRFTGGSYSGSMDTDSSFGETLSAQDVLTGRWINADPGATATMTITGYKMAP